MVTSRDNILVIARGISPPPPPIRVRVRVRVTALTSSPLGFFSAFQGGCGETDVTLTIKAIAKSPPAEGDEIEGEDVIALYDGLVDTCYAGSTTTRAFLTTQAW